VFHRAVDVLMEGCLDGAAGWIMGMIWKVEEGIFVGRVRCESRVWIEKL